MWKNATFAVYVGSSSSLSLVQVDVAASGNVTTTCFLFSKMEERIKLKCRCGGSQQNLSFVQRCLSTSSQLSVLCVFIAYKDYQYYSPHIFLKVNFRATIMTLV